MLLHQLLLLLALTAPLTSALVLNKWASQERQSLHVAEDLRLPDFPPDSWNTETLLVDDESDGLPLPFPSTGLDTLGALSTKFYVYDWLNWTSLNCGGIPVDALVGNVMSIRHTDDYWFMKTAIKHPMRTSNPEEAELFVLPSLMNIVLAWLFRLDVPCCIGDLCDVALLNYTEAMLANSSWFQRKGGKDHVAVCSHYHCRLEGHRWPLIKRCNTIAFEHNCLQAGRCRIASTYVGRRCDHEEKRYNFGMVCSLRSRWLRPPKHMFNVFPARATICSWLHDLKGQAEDFNYSSCGPGPQCPALAQARFGFHALGDTWGSERPIDTILSGTVPMFTSEEQYKILPPFVPWRNITVLVNITDETSFEASLRRSLPLYEELKQRVDANAHLVDWEMSSSPFENYMQLFQKCASVI